ncbi:hypothetical protein GCM10023231_21450 [Olivibacter ginsenosidimutans]|uniref:Crp/Fnr family transcriptional regulator n=2 Tax=Olivibacter ginsenosidimutans TaxID=1176537 RepID=A0ABP9BB37_9SPHI
MCRHSSKGWLPAIVEERKIKIFKRGEVIFKEGEKAEGIYFLLQGIVKVHKQWGEDRELILHFSKAGELFGYRGLSDDTVYPVTATVLEDCKTCYVSIDFFNKTLQANHELTLQFLKFHLNELRRAEKRMRNLALMEVKGRIADMLLMLHKQFGIGDDGYIRLQLKRQDMAAYAGTTYETFFRMVNELVKEGAILVKSKQFKIIDKKKLEHYDNIESTINS